jgi:Dirigent-like protein
LKLKLLVAAAATVTLSIAGAAGAANGTGVTMHLVEKDAGGNFVDNKPYAKPGAHTASIGDMFVFSSTLLTRANKHAGMLYGSCIAATAGKSPTFECTGTFTLAGGDLALQTITREPDKVTHIAIVGGTGAYEGARGSITSVSRGPNSNYSDDTIHLLPRGF